MPTRSGLTASGQDLESELGKGMLGPETESSDGQPAPSANYTFKNLVELANDGDNGALGQLRNVLDENPKIWQRVGDLAAHARMTLMRMIAGDDKLLFESIDRKASAMEAELLGPSPTALERLSAERVVACWLQLQYADTASSAPSETIAQEKFWAQRQDQAHRRYQASVRQLLAIREALPKSGQSATPVPAAANSATTAPAESNGARHTEADTEPRTASINGNGRLNGSRTGNGRIAETDDEPGPANGEPVNRILAFGKTTKVASAADE